MGRSMLEKIPTDKKLAKAEYRARMPELQERLFQLQRRCWESGLGVLVVVEGWSASGKGKAIKKLTERLEPRAVEIHAIRAPRTHEVPLPWMYRFWVRLPSYGKFGIFVHSWYRRVLLERLTEGVSKAEVSRAFEDINDFERALSDDRYAIIKLFLHIDKRGQKKRLKKIEADPSSSWRVTSRDWAQHRAYDDYTLATEKMLAATETEWAPWTIVESNNGRFARIKVFETLINRLEHELAHREVLAREKMAHGARTRFEPIGHEETETVAAIPREEKD